MLPEGGIGLGNFWKLFESLGMPTEAAVLPLPPLDESEFSNSDDALLPSPALEAIQDAPKAVYEELAQAENGRTTTPMPGTTKKQRRKARRQAEKAQEQALNDTPPVVLKEVLNALADVSINHDTETPIDTPTKPSRAQSNVSAKIRPASPAPAPDAAQAAQTPRTVQRPVLSKRARSSVVPVTPQPQPQPQTQFQSVPLLHGTAPITNISKPAPFQYSLASQLQPLQATTIPAGPGLVPRTVRPVTLPRQSFHARSQPPAIPLPATPSPVPFPPAGYATPLSRPSITLRSKVDRHFHLFEKLLIGFPEEREWLISPRQLLNENTKAEGIHVFVDASNIIIGFNEMLRQHGVQPYDLSFDSLALLMERRRPNAKRALVGSIREANPLPATQRLIETCKAVGYEANMQEQVYIAREESKKKKFFNDVNRFGWQKAIQKRSGSGSDSETGAAATPKTPVPQRWVEQGVDELLHLKMCQSLLDTDIPSTMVLATGDGAEAEMSDGFLANVERALRKGWKVELITWKQQMNGGYKRRAFRQKWGEQFTIIELDDFLEDLIETP